MRKVLNALRLRRTWMAIAALVGVLGYGQAALVVETVGTVVEEVDKASQTTVTEEDPNG